MLSLKLTLPQLHVKPEPTAGIIAALTRDPAPPQLLHNYIAECERSENGKRPETRMQD